MVSSVALFVICFWIFRDSCFDFLDLIALVYVPTPYYERQQMPHANSLSFDSKPRTRFSRGKRDVWRGGGARSIFYDIAFIAFFCLVVLYYYCSTACAGGKGGSRCAVKMVQVTISVFFMKESCRSLSRCEEGREKRLTYTRRCVLSLHVCGGVFFLCVCENMSRARGVQRSYLRYRKAAESFCASLAWARKHPLMTPLASKDPSLR